VKTDAGELVLDPGTPNAPYGVVAWWKGHVPGLRVAKKQEAVWFETPELRSQDAVVSRKATLHVDDDALKGKITVTYAGQQALVRRIAHQTDDEAATKKALEESMKSHLPDGAKVTLVSITGMKNAEPEVVVQYDVEVPGAASSTGSRMIIPISFFRQKEKNPFTSAERRTPVYFEYPAVEEDDVTLELPAGYAIESLPGEAPIDGGSIGFSAKTVSQHGAVHFTRRFVIDSMFFPRDQYKAVQAVFARVTSADQEQVVLKAAK